MQQQAFHVDERLQIGSERATVRYIGQVSSQSGEWVGLEWDNESRGKHDGSVNGHRYFECIYAGERPWCVVDSALRAGYALTRFQLRVCKCRSCGLLRTA